MITKFTSVSRGAPPHLISPSPVLYRYGSRWTEQVDVLRWQV